MIRVIFKHELHKKYMSRNLKTVLLP